MPFRKRGHSGFLRKGARKVECNLGETSTSVSRARFTGLNALAFKKVIL